MQLGTKLILFGLLLFTLLVVVTEGQLKALRRGRMPKGMPEGMTLEEFLESRGQGRKKHANIRKLARRIKQRLLRSGEKLPDDIDDRFDDIVFTEEQLLVMDQMTAPTGRRGKHSRKKRKVVNFEIFKKWPTTTIYYMMDGTQTQEQADFIHLAVNHWAERTCIRFIEGSNDISAYPYIYITRNDSSGCWSYVGRVNLVGPQILNLAGSCFYDDGRYGTIVHELGHALGLVHEHTRDDRDDYVIIVQSNIRPGKESQFSKWPTGYLDANIIAAVHYDYGSIMHYSSTSFSATGSPTIESKTPLFGSTMGQRHYLTFWDAYAINLAYCSGACSNITSPPCQRGGYQDPNNCNSCVCPEGFTGQYCEQDEANTAVCPDAGHISLGAELSCIQVYMTSTSNDAVCDWHVETTPGVKIEFWFENMNLVYFSSTKQCYDFVEVKYMNNLIDRGPRFCEMVSDHFTSDISELMVSFRSYYYSDTYTPFFKLCFKALQETTTTPPVMTTTVKETTAAPQIMTTTVKETTAAPQIMTTTVKETTAAPQIMTTTVKETTTTPPVVITTMKETTAAPQIMTTTVKETTAVPQIMTTTVKETTAAPQIMTTTVKETTAAPQIMTTTVKETTAAPQIMTTTVKETTAAPQIMTTTVKETTAAPQIMTTTVKETTAAPQIMTTTVTDRTEPPTTEYPEVTTRGTRPDQKHNRKHKNRTRKLRKKLEQIFGATTPSNLPQKRKALRKLLRELLASSRPHGEGDSY